MTGGGNGTMNGNVNENRSSNMNGNTGGNKNGSGNRRKCGGGLTRICLCTALAAFVLGAALCGVGGLLGGFRQLEGLDVEELTGIPFVYNGHAFGFVTPLFSGNSRYSDWAQKYKDWDRLGETEEIVNGIASDFSGGKRLPLTADTLRELYIEAGACEVVIEEYAGDHVSLAVGGDAEHFRYRVKDGVLQIVGRPMSGSLWGRSDDKIWLRLPRGAFLDYLSLEVGAGELNCGKLSAADVSIEVDAGECVADRIAADGAVTLSVGAGDLSLNTLVCRQADIDVAAGDLEIADATVTDGADIALGMGDVDIEGRMSGELDVDCDMGEVTLTLRGTAREYNYDIDCSMGTVNVGADSYSGMGAERSIDNGAGNDFHIDCSMGTVNIIFDAAGNAYQE